MPDVFEKQLTLTESQYRAYITLVQHRVSVAARERGWNVERYHQAADRPTCVPFGIVLCERTPVTTLLGPDNEWLTAEWALHEDGVFEFYSGHYDLTWNAALSDFKERCDKHAI